MCGRYALGVRLAFIRHRLQQQGMQVDEAPEDDEIRETYNFAPGYNGVAYRADTPDYGHDSHDQLQRTNEIEEIQQEVKGENYAGHQREGDENRTKYKLQKMRWGLIPFWTKHQPGFSSLMRTINCRADSLIDDKGMWTSMKKRKRCVVICQGFYEWLQRGKQKIPHFVKRKDGELMYFAGLWDCVKYEGTDEKIYTYTIITTDSNSALKFLHDRMPVILEPGSEAMKTWLDPNRTTWSNQLQSLLRPYEGELECYPVSKEVGKVGNNSPDFVVPVDSRQNRKNIANFFANAEKKESSKGEAVEMIKKVESEDMGKGHRHETENLERSENTPTTEPEKIDIEDPTTPQRGIKRDRSPTDQNFLQPEAKAHKKVISSPSPKRQTQLLSPSKHSPKTRQLRSVNRNDTPPSTKNKMRGSDGSQKITSFFKK